MNREALAEAPSVRPKFLDFKIYADENHHTVGFGLNLMPLSGSAAVANAGEWIASKFVVPNTAGSVGAVNNFEVIATGSSYPGTGSSGLNAVSLIEGYAASRGLPNIEDPNTPSDAADANGSTPENWMSALFNEGTSQDDQVLTDMITENNEAPYPFENDGTFTDTMYPGGANQLPGMQFHDVEYFTPTTISNTIRLKGGNFPCGLVRFDCSNQSADAATITIIVDMIPGTHRGYLCEPMTEM